MTRESNSSPCVVCGGVRFRPLCRTDRFRSGLATSMCTGCGLVRVDPLPDGSLLGAFYRDEYPLQYEKPAQPTAAWLEASGQRRRARHTVDFLASRGVLREGMRILDFGCGAGSVLSELRRRLPEAALYGVEANPDYAAFAAAQSGARVATELGGPNDGSGRELIILSHVLEHLPDPVQQLRELRALLAGGGGVLIDVPDVTAYRSVNDLHPAHLYHFSPATLAAVVRRAGLDPGAIERHRPPRHPRSLRCLAVMPGENVETATLPRPDPGVVLRLRGIALAAPAWHGLRCAVRFVRSRRSPPVGGRGGAGE